MRQLQSIWGKAGAACRCLPATFRHHHTHCVHLSHLMLSQPGCAASMCLTHASGQVLGAWGGGLWVQLQGAASGQHHTSLAALVYSAAQHMLSAPGAAASPWCQHVHVLPANCQSKLPPECHLKRRMAHILTCCAPHTLCCLHNCPPTTPKSVDAMRRR